MAFRDISLTVEVATTDNSDHNDLVMLLDANGLLVVIHNTYHDRQECIPDSIELPEPIHEVGLYRLNMCKDGETFKIPLWVIPAESILAHQK